MTLFTIKCIYLRCHKYKAIDFSWAYIWHPTTDKLAVAFQITQRMSTLGVDIVDDEVGMESVANIHW